MADPVNEAEEDLLDYEDEEEAPAGARPKPMIRIGISRQHDQRATPLEVQRRSDVGPDTAHDDACPQAQAQRPRGGVQGALQSDVRPDHSQRLRRERSMRRGA
jgi:hypothetical protein